VHVEKERRVEERVIFREELRLVDDLMIVLLGPLMDPMDISARRDIEGDVLQAGSMARVSTFFQGRIEEDLGSLPVGRPVAGVPLPHETHKRHEVVVVRPRRVDVWHA
jgi:hypothetical protein